jgi:hypothetical protein
MACCREEMLPEEKIECCQERKKNKLNVVKDNICQEKLRTCCQENYDFLSGKNRCCQVKCKMNNIYLWCTPHTAGSRRRSSLD